MKISDLRTAASIDAAVTDKPLFAYGWYFLNWSLYESEGLVKNEARISPKLSIIIFLYENENKDALILTFSMASSIKRLNYKPIGLWIRRANALLFIVH